MHQNSIFIFRSVLFPFAIKVCDLLCVCRCVNLLLLSMMARCGAFFFFFKFAEGFFFPLGLKCGETNFLFVFLS